MTDTPTSPELEAIQAALVEVRRAATLFERDDFLSWRAALEAEAAANTDRGGTITQSAERALIQLQEALIHYPEAIARRAARLEAEEAALIEALTPPEEPEPEGEGAPDEGGGGAPEA